MCLSQCTDISEMISSTPAANTPAASTPVTTMLVKVSFPQCHAPIRNSIRTSIRTTIRTTIRTSIHTSIRTSTTLFQSSITPITPITSVTPKTPTDDNGDKIDEVVSIFSRKEFLITMGTILIFVAVVPIVMILLFLNIHPKYSIIREV